MFKMRDITGYARHVDRNAVRQQVRVPLTICFEAMQKFVDKGKNVFLSKLGSTHCLEKWFPSYSSPQNPTGNLFQFLWVNTS